MYLQQIGGKLKEFNFRFILKSKFCTLEEEVDKRQPKECKYKEDSQLKKH